MTTSPTTSPGSNRQDAMSNKVHMNQVLDRLIDAERPADVIAAIEAAFDSDGALFIIDHDFGQLRSLADQRTVTLDGELAEALAAANSVSTSDGWWLPIPERDAVALVMLFAAEPAAGDRDPMIRISNQIGLCTPMLRRRFEDFEQRRRRHDMSVAAELQWSVLPPCAGTVGGFSFASALEPAYEVAGDLFDYSYFDGALWVYSLDAMGHGLDATMSGVIALTAIRKARRDGANLTEQMDHANDVVHGSWNGDRFVTAVGCRLDAEAIAVVNAGHEPLRRRSGDSVSALTVTPSLPLGIDSAASYPSHRIEPLGRDQSLILLSDGSAESRNSLGAAYGAAAVNAALAASWNESPFRAIRGYLDRLTMFSAGVERGDDITAVVVSVATGTTNGQTEE